MKRCRTCCYPDTKPDLYFDETGECSACISYRKRKSIDWGSRLKDLMQIIETTPRNDSGYDCIVPSSGGKDSTAQVLKMIELGLRPLAVTATTCMLSDIGKKNIENLARYATTIEVSPNKEVRRKLNRLGLQMVGDISHPEHMAIFSTPFKIACDFGIPLIWFGESPQSHYGGPLGSDEAVEMTRRWTSEYGGMLGLRPSDFVGIDGITERDMEDYMLPSDERMNKVGVTARFLGQYIDWNSRTNAEIAKSHGMIQVVPCTANYLSGENVDNIQTGIHDFFCYLKYGYGRGCAQINADVRDGLISRDTALAWIELNDGAFPDYYLGVHYSEVLDHIGMTRDQFHKIENQFRAQ